MEGEVKEYPKQPRQPSVYSPELTKKICHAISTSEKGLHRLHKDLDWFPAPGTILKWRTEYPEFDIQYARAREEQHDLIAEQILEIIDNEEKDLIEGKKPNSAKVQRDRNRIDARKWLLSKLQPKKYGDKIDITSDGKKINTGAFPVPAEVFNQINAEVNNGIPQDSKPKEEA